MDPFDERILSALRKARCAGFEQLQAETGISHNTVRLHLHRLVCQGIVAKEKMPSEKREDPASPTLCLPKSTGSRSLLAPAPSPTLLR